VVRALRANFAAQLQSPRAQSALNAAVKALADCQFEPWVVTHGSKSSLFANHSSSLRIILDVSRHSLLELSAARKRWFHYTTVQVAQ